MNSCSSFACLSSDNSEKRRKNREIYELLALWALVLLRVWIPYFHWYVILGAGYYFFVLIFLIFTQYRRMQVAGSGFSFSRLRKEGGLNWVNFIPCFLRLFPSSLVAFLLIFLVHNLYQTSYVCPSFFIKWGAYFFWAVAQQYLLQGYILARLRTVVSHRFFLLILTAFFFSSVHIPNPVLTLVTFVGGALLSDAFEKYPNLFAVGLVHSGIAAALQCYLGEGMLRGMHVGYFYIFPPQE
ncbi:MAG: CPBP family glutamic-type intramembrane protease [bacterium JZ-2024 1]